jgi:hypothetical protein
MSLDLENDYKKAKDKVKSIKNYKDLQNQYSKLKKKTKDSFDKKSEKTAKKLSKAKKKVDDANEKSKKFKKNAKTQFEHLLEVLTLTNESGGNTYNYIKRTFLKTLNNIEPKVLDILYKEIFKTVGCDQQQAFNQNTTVYIKVKSIDLVNLLKIDPNDIEGRCLYEKRSLAPNDRPNSTNKELYNRIQFPGVSFNSQYGTDYLGKSNQPLFDITFFESHPVTGEGGGWYKVDIRNRGGRFLISEFLLDYFKTIKVVEFENIVASIMEQLTGMISISIGAGQYQIEDMAKFQIILQRILGLCFDEDKEINVSGNAKVSELDGVDNSFFEFTDDDLSTIEERVNNIKNGVVKFLECNYVDIPVDSGAIINSLNNLIFVEGNNLIDEADNLTNQVNNDPQFNGFDIQLALNVNFVKLISQGLVVSLLSPKVLLPIYIAFKGLGNNIVDIIDSFVEFSKQFYGLVVNLVSKVGALFIEELFEIIKKDIKVLVQQVISDILRESNNKKLKMIAKLAEILIIVANLIQDWRKCKSVIDDILSLLKLIPNNPNGVPLPLLLLSRFLDGYSETRAFIGMIDELQNLGIPTGTLPDGSPNLDLLSRFGQMKAMASEEAENGRVDIALDPLIIPPTNTTTPLVISGKKF